MIFFRWIGLLCIIMLMASCSSMKKTHALQCGKAKFDAGNYKQSFHYLLPIAADGNPQAQYAVGYMYYYGYGVAQDSESGLFWIQRAASQHDPSAIQALRLINKKPSDVAYKKKLYHPKQNINENNYGFQLIGAYQLPEVKQLRDRLHLQQDSAIWRTSYHGKDWYLLTYGNYSSIMRAKLAYDQLPLSIRQLSPWIRKLSGLQQI